MVITSIIIIYENDVVVYVEVKFLSFYILLSLQCRAGLVSGPDVFKVVEAFSNETNYTVWNDLISNMGGVGAILQYSDCYLSFQAFGIKLYEPIGNKLGWDPVEGEGRSFVHSHSFVLFLCSFMWYGLLCCNKVWPFI